MRRLLFVGIFIVLGAGIALGAGKGVPATPFQQYNPDVDKYAFAKSYIQSLNYYGRLAKRLRDEQAAGSGRFAEDLGAIKALVDGRTLDNTELRVAKNYLSRYSTSGNMLIRKVAYDAMSAYEQHIVISSSERRLWQAYYKFKEFGVPRDLNEAGFRQQIESLARDRKAAALAVLETVVMFKTVLLSARQCADEHCRDLDLTQAQRNRLIRKLDEFAGDNMAWGIKVGQGTFEAAVASLREVLEDSSFSSRK